MKKNNREKICYIYDTSCDDFIKNDNGKYMQFTAYDIDNFSKAQKDKNTPNLYSRPFYDKIYHMKFSHHGTTPYLASIGKIDGHHFYDYKARDSESDIHEYVKKWFDDRLKQVNEKPLKIYINQLKKEFEIDNKYYVKSEYITERFLLDFFEIDVYAKLDYKKESKFKDEFGTEIHFEIAKSCPVDYFQVQHARFNNVTVLEFVIPSKLKTLDDVKRYMAKCYDMVYLDLKNKHINIIKKTAKNGTVYYLFNNCRYFINENEDQIYVKITNENREERYLNYLPMFHGETKKKPIKSREMAIGTICYYITEHQDIL